MSIVYLAMDNRLNKSIVVKEIRRRDNSNNKLLMNSLKQESDLLKILIMLHYQRYMTSLTEVISMW